MIAFWGIRYPFLLTPFSYPLTTVEALQTPTRIVAVSATLPNICEIAAFLDANEAHVFDSSYRPVTLNTHVLGMGYIGNRSNSNFLFCFDVLETRSLHGNEVYDLPRVSKTDIPPK